MANNDNYLLFLNNINGFGPKTICGLLNKVDNISELWKLSFKELEELGLKKKNISDFLKLKDKINGFNIIKELKKKDIKYLTIKNENYPLKLKNIYDPPPVIYYKGELNFALPAVAIIGSRNSTIYGRKIAFKTSSSLAEEGINIISGLARGIDSTAHKGALNIDAGITTAVLGNGFDYIYPSENRYLYQEIEKDGLIITEFNPDTAPKAANFPRRNRIISALADLILVVEAGKKSGTMITVDYALEHGKDVMAVPANIDRPTSVGSNKLIKKGAAVFTAVQDVLDYLKKYLRTEKQENDFQFSQSQAQAIFPTLSIDEKKVLKLFQHEVELYYNEILKLSNLDTDKVDKILIKFELMNLIIRLKAKKYRFKGLQNLLKPI
ncbi:MAG: DNA-processing protein DprA [Bacillota bacterium]